MEPACLQAVHGCWSVNAAPTPLPHVCTRAHTPCPVFPQLDAAAKWLKSLPSAKRPLVKSSVQLASDDAVEKLQLTLAPVAPRGRDAMLPVELEAVPAQLLLPPYDPAAAVSTLAGGGFELGDRVVVLIGGERGSG